MERNITLIALFAALIAALGLVPKFDLAGGVPITAQSLGVMLAGTILGARRGALAVLLFLFLVALGLPLLAGGRGGLGVFQGPTAGFIVGFPLAALVTGWASRAWAGRGATGVLGTALAALLGGVVVLYVFGIAGFALVTDRSFGAAAAIMWVFVPGDVIKAVLAGFITQGVLRARPDLARG
ncbi:biotin transporter BioY [Lutimaribacter sp. EGI FJ00015]|uniref:Biotin transporter BioY n=1 Tax=Lutimaribacter degradans TaxID=2945989 RepID=A0ACC5ZUR5_9RHOB|nr:biotin transporter BioY [Lutimaribacter sp. EGI FJ00013]MCM2561134.1 biotin transporter BioY [Lutimaribacter sp. EGI FJ00013]MCO0611917.1 biotin transporter BioY [Lutimaribacter sp. EGI FJ00015]MCO0634962.1 biotin transporter BioY [Lutimaribacter sp. EGI FJ00014]